MTKRYRLAGVVFSCTTIALAQLPPSIKEFNTGLTGNSTPHGITAGPDGAMWFTEWDGNKIGRITTAGVISKFLVPTPNGTPSSITLRARRRAVVYRAGSQ